MLNENIQKATAGCDKVALSFSGGTDSLALLFSCFDLGIKPQLYTYAVQGNLSDDLKRAMWAEKEFGLKLTVAYIPTSLSQLITDVKRLVAHGIKGKVCIQCMHGHFYLAPLVKEKIILNGSGIDGLCGSYRSFILSKARIDKATFNEKRQRHLNNQNDDSMQYQSALYADFGTRVAFPYRQKNVIDFLMSKSWEEINRPKLKWITVKDYPEILRVKGLWRSRGSQQIEAGTRRLHDKLLNSILNKNGRKRVTEIYKDLSACIEEK